MLIGKNLLYGHEVGDALKLIFADRSMHVRLVEDLGSEFSCEEMGLLAILWHKVTDRSKRIWYSIQGRFWEMFEKINNFTTTMIMYFERLFTEAGCFISCGHEYKRRTDGTRMCIRCRRHIL